MGPGPVNTNLRPGLLNTDWGPGPVNTNWEPGPVNTNRGPGPVNTNWGPGPGAGKYKYPFKWHFFDELLIFFWLTLKDIFCILINHLYQKILYVNKYSKIRKRWNKNQEKHFLLSQKPMLKSPCFLMQIFKVH